MQKMQDGEWAYGIREDISLFLNGIADKCSKFNSIPVSCSAERYQLLKSLLGKVGENVFISSPFRCDFGKYISIGNNFVGNYNLSILDEAPVTIGDNVFIGPNVSIITVIHALTIKERNDGIMTCKPVTIGNNVWICANVTILPGVTIGDGAVIGAGSVVTKSIPDNVLAAGNPCKVIRNITENDTPPLPYVR